RPPAPGLRPGLSDCAGRAGAVLVLAAVRAAFRLHLGGAGEHVGVQPDLACYSKALGNGHAIAACLGREALREAATRVFFTGSFWTSGVAMAAATACLEELASSGAIARMAQVGNALRAGIEQQAAAHRLEIRYSGPPAIP